MNQQGSRAGALLTAPKTPVFCRAAFAGVALAWVSVLAYSSPSAIERVETTNAVLSFKAGSGDLIGVQWKGPQLELIGEAKLGENFRILLPRPDYEANYFNSRDQVLSRIEKFPNRVVLHYDSLRNERETLKVKVTYEIQDTGSQLLFSIQVDNTTDHKLAEVVYGMIGGQQGIADRLDTESLIPAHGHSGSYGYFVPKLFSQRIFDFSTESLGVRFDSVGYAYPSEMSMGWMDVYNPKADIGYYYANQDPETRVTALYVEMHPYNTYFVPELDTWPSAAELPAGEPIGLTMAWVNFPFTAKATFHAGPVALQVHEGDWHTGAKLYRAWFDQHFQVARPLNWLRKEMAWQSVVLLGPEDVIHFRFKDLPRLAADAKRYGVTTMHIYGWHSGGVDRGYPNYTPDPRLGTVDEFRKALAEMRAMGVHPLLFVNLLLADTSTEAFRTRLSRYAVEGRWEPDWQLFGSGGGTIGARMMGTGRKMARLSPSHPEFREELIRHYLDRIQDGAEGLMLDQTEDVGFPDFNPTIPTLPDKSLPQGILKSFDEYLNRARKINADIALAAESQFDRAFPYIDVSRIDMGSSLDAGSIALRYTFPEWTSTILADAPGDIDTVNNGLRYGLVWDIAPRHYTDSMDEALTRPLSRYLREQIRIRGQFPDVLFHGRFNDTEGATVTGDKDNIRYSVFTPMNLDSPQRACVVVNFGDREESAEVSISGMEGQKAKISGPFEPDRVATLPVKLMLPPHRTAVVVAEQ